MKANYSSSQGSRTQRRPENINQQKSGSSHHPQILQDQNQEDDKRADFFVNFISLFFGDKM